MLLYTRQNQILNYLNQNRFATIKELSKLVFSSESSVRRDIKTLEQKGYVNQIYGGVVLAEYKDSVVPISLRDSANSSVKEKIAKTAAQYIHNGATVMMDGSSTVRRIIKYIDKSYRLNIITNNQHIFNECTNEKIILYCTGGIFNSKNHIFTGSSAETFLNNIYADILFFSSQAISDDGIISDISEEETHIRKIMISRSNKKIFLCDSSKLGLNKTFSLCTKDDIDKIICDKPLPWENNQQSV